MKHRIICMLCIVMLIMLISGCKSEPDIRGVGSQYTAAGDTQKDTEHESIDKNEILLRFLEIGSDGCIPCKMMRPVMDQVKDHYNNVQVLFYDINTDSGKDMAKSYNVRLIPTQIFIDNNDNTVLRHEGFYAYEEMSVFIDSFIGADQ